jgi:predicted HicB family RNase H-like nuclease
MTDTLEYNGYTGSVEYSAEDECLYGKLLNIRDLVNYEAEDVKSLKAEFEAAVDDYLVTCEELGKAPDKPYKGVFNVRVSPQIHRDLDILAARTGESLNKVVGEGLTVFTDLIAALPGEVMASAKGLPQLVNEIARTIDLSGTQGQAPKAKAKAKARLKTGRKPPRAKAPVKPSAKSLTAAKAKRRKQMEDIEAKSPRRKLRLT